VAHAGWLAPRLFYAAKRRPVRGSQLGHGSAAGDPGHGVLSAGSVS
jgi:hypothetical protein